MDIKELNKKLVEELTPEEENKLRVAASQDHTYTDKVKEELKSKGWNAQGFLYKTGVSVYAEKGNVSASIKDNEIKVQIPQHEITSKEGLNELVNTLNELNEVIK